MVSLKFLLLISNSTLKVPRIGSKKVFVAVKPNSAQPGAGEKSRSSDLVSILARPSGGAKVVLLNVPRSVALKVKTGTTLSFSASSEQKYTVVDNKIHSALPVQSPQDQTSPGSSEGGEGGNQVRKSSEGSEQTERTERKELELDKNYVLARQVADKTVKFNMDKDKKVSEFREKMLKAIRLSDIMEMRKALLQSDVKIPWSFFPPPPPVGLDTKNSPETSFDRPRDMPVVTVTEKPKVKAVEETKSPKPKVKVQLEPLDLFPSLEKTSASFKIPRKKKAPRWVVNGALWQWALSVDDNGQRCR